LGTWPTGRDELEEARAEDDEGEAAAEGQEGAPEGAQAAQQSEYGATKTGEDEYVCKIPSMDTSVTFNTSRLENTDSDEAAGLACGAFNDAMTAGGGVGELAQAGLEEAPGTVHLTDGQSHVSLWDPDTTRWSEEGLVLNIDAVNLRNEGFFGPARDGIAGLVVEEYAEKGLYERHNIGAMHTDAFGKAVRSLYYEQAGYGDWAPDYNTLAGLQNILPFAKFAMAFTEGLVKRDTKLHCLKEPACIYQSSSMPMSVPGRVACYG
jgi:hypothetical protein